MRPISFSSCEWFSVPTHLFSHLRFFHPTSSYSFSLIIYWLLVLFPPSYLYPCSPFNILVLSGSISNPSHNLQLQFSSPHPHPSITCFNILVPLSSVCSLLSLKVQSSAFYSSSLNFVCTWGRMPSEAQDTHILFALSSNVWTQHKTQ